MGTPTFTYPNHLLNHEGHETTPSSPIRKLFSLKRGPSEKKKMIQNVLEKQESLGGKITELTEDRYSVLHELSTINKCIVDLTTKVADLLALNDHKKDYDNELKRQVKQGRNENVIQADELRKSNKERHKFELEVCRLESLVGKLNNDLNNANTRKDNAEDSLVGYKNNITKMKGERSDLRLEVQRQQDIIRELSVDVQVLKEQISRLKNDNEEGQKRIEKMRGDRRKLLEYLRHKSEVYEDRLKVSWLEISGLKQERNQLKDKGPSMMVQLPNPAPFVLNNNETFLGMAQGPKWDRNDELERQKTRVMQLELQLYRREKLVEILVDKIKHHDRSFDLMADSSLLAYLDENWSLDAECSEFSEVSTTTWSQISSVSSIDDQFSMLLK